MKSQAIVCVLVVLCSALSVNSNPAATYIQAKADQSLMKYMMKPRAQTMDASNSMACFNYYIPLLNQITSDYQKNYEACLTIADEQLAALKEEGTEVRANITSVSNNVCSLFNTCQANEDNLGFFDCYTNLGDESVREVYTISQDASEAAANYREQSRVITATCDKCTNETQRIYVIDTANAYDELDLCLVNGLKTTTLPPTTTTTEEVTTTTEEVTTTTEEVITTTEEVTTTTEGSTTAEETTSTTEGVTTTTEVSTIPEVSTTEETTTTTGAETETPEKDPVEELRLTENTARNRLEAFVRNWNKRLA